ncbi:MAG: hypothetical protein RLY58_2391 [Pseudomonadota bacterium]|jgi:hypothetical protein
MAFTPDDIRRNHAINDDAARRRAKESHARQAAANLKASKNNATDRRERLNGRDKEIKEQLAASVTHKSLPDGIDANGLLALTFGNDKRRYSEFLTNDDLRQYSRNVNVAAEKFKGGITPKQVIDWAAPIDIKRSNEQIHLGVLLSRKGDLFRYQTNAGPDSKVTHHFVDVKFLGYGEMVSGARDRGIQSIKSNVVGGKIRFTCDCGRHRYHYNYLAGLGNYHLGQKESRFPFIKNPHLVGLACKHVLRVMHIILSATHAQKILSEVKKDRAKTDTRVRVDNTSQSEINEAIDKQLKQLNGKRSQIMPTEQRPAYIRKLKRQAELAAKKERELQEGRAAFDQMTAQLRALGYTDEQIAAFKRSNQ